MKPFTTAAAQIAAASTAAASAPNPLPTAAAPAPKPLPRALAQFDELPGDSHVRVQIVAPVFGVSLATVWRWSKSGRLPQPRRLSPGVTAWRVSELRAAMAKLGA